MKRAALAIALTVGFVGLGHAEGMPPPRPLQKGGGGSSQSPPVLDKVLDTWIGTFGSLRGKKGMRFVAHRAAHALEPGAEVCILGFKRITRGRRRTTMIQSGCPVWGSGYAFHAERWRAWAWGRVNLTMFKAYERFRNGQWKTVGHEHPPGTSPATIRLAFRGRGEERMALEGGCQHLPVARLSFKRDAVVSGTVSFDWLRTTVEVPAGQTSWMNYCR